MLGPDHGVHSVARGLVAAAMPAATVVGIRRIPTALRHPLHRVELSDGSVLMLSEPVLVTLSSLGDSVPTSTRSEACILAWFTEMRKGDSAGKARMGRRGAIVISQAEKLLPYVPCLLGNLPVRRESFLSVIDLDLSEYGEYNLTAPTPGSTVATLATPLTTDERRIVDRQVGQLLRYAAVIQSPCHRFGFPPTALPHQPGVSIPCYADGAATRTWSSVFDLLVLEVQRDASVKMLNIPFGRLRTQFERFRAVLDRVMRARLVLLSAGDDANTLVRRDKPGHGRSTVGDADSKVVSGNPRSDDTSDITVTGFRDWSECMFGDPLIARALCQSPSTGLIRAFFETSEFAIPSLETPSDLIDDRRNIHIRLLLYQGYWAIRDIVKRPNLPWKEGAASPAWKTLNDAVKKLEALPSPATTTETARSKRLHVQGRRGRSASPQSGEDWKVDTGPVSSGSRRKFRSRTP